MSSRANEQKIKELEAEIVQRDLKLKRALAKNQECARRLQLMSRDKRAKDNIIQRARVQVISQKTRIAELQKANALSSKEQQEKQKNLKEKKEKLDKDVPDDPEDTQIGRAHV